jgi:ATP-dependent Clp protease ATP-binding subunit ClpC
MTRKQEPAEYVANGIAALQAGDREGAVLMFQTALELAPEHAEAALHLGETFMTLRSWTNAAEAFRLAAANAEHPAGPIPMAAALHALGAALLECGLIHEAAERLEDAAAREGRPEVWLALGRARRKLHDHEAALAAYREAAQRKPDDIRPYRGMAACLTTLGRLDEATALWADVEARFPTSPHPAKGRAELAALRQAGVPAPVAAIAKDEILSRVAWAEALERDGRLDEALAGVDEVLRKRPGQTSAWCVRGRVLSQLQRWDDAVTAWQGALRNAPQRVEALAGLASALGELGRAEEGLAAVQRAIDLSPDDLDIRLVHAELLRRVGRHADALHAYDEILAKDPTHRPAILGRATTFAAAGRFAEALPLWRQVLRVDPENPVALRGLRRAERELAAHGDPAAPPQPTAGRIPFDLGKSMMQQGRFAEAIPSFARALAARTDWAEPWHLQAVCHVRLGDLPAAIAALREATRIEPEHVEAAVLLGDLCRQTADHNGAREAYDAALAIAPDFAAAIAGHADASRLLGDRRAAVEGFERAASIDPTEFLAVAGMAALLTTELRFGEAQVWWERAQGVRPTAAWVRRGLEACAQRNAGLAEAFGAEPVPPPPIVTHDDRQLRSRQAASDELDRGRSYYKERNFPAAVQAFRKALEIDPTFAEAALRLGMAYEDDRQYRKAIAAYESCLDIDPQHVQAATNIGEAYRKNERYLDAISAYDRALQIRPEYLFAMAGRAECLRMTQNFEEANEWFDRALKGGPNHAFAIQGKAATLNALGRFKEAIPWWGRALEIDTHSAFAADGKAYAEQQLRRAGSAGGARPIEPAAPPMNPEAGPPPDGEADAESVGGTPILDSQGRDLSALALAGLLPPVIGREAEIRSVMKTLVRRLKANPLLVGEPGVGKTAVVEGVARKLVQDDAPERLKGLRIVELSMGTLVAGTKYRGTFEERLKDIVKEAKSVPGIVLFIDEIHTLVGAGRTEGGSLDAANILKPALARGELTVIGATTWAEFRKHVESDSALERRFQPIDVKEPSEAECLELLDRVRGVYEEHHEVEVDDGALQACVRMSVRYVPDRRLPDKALDLLDEACAEASLSAEPKVTLLTVARVIAERTGVPVDDLADADRARISHFESLLSKRVIGQDAAIGEIANAVRLARSGLRADDRPRGVFLFRGPSGVGKTELARALSDALFPEGDALVRLDMSEYTDKFTVSRLLGAPPGYAGHGEEGQLTGPLRRRPYSVVLLDEFEKAHPDVQAVFLSLLDDGRITDAEGREINAREAWFVLTTNAGTDQRSGRVGFGGGGHAGDARAIESLKAWFRPDLLHRIDTIVSLDRLGPDALRVIAVRELERLADRAGRLDCALVWSDDVVDRLVAASADKDDGARAVIRMVAQQVGEPLGKLWFESGDALHPNWRAVVLDDAIQLLPA